jgi:NADH-quinone oxidoreductase subunit N
MSIADLEIILPELLLLVIALTGQMIGVFSKKPQGSINFMLIGVIFLTPVIFYSIPYYAEGFDGSIVIDSQISTIKTIILILVAIVILLYQNFCDIAIIEPKSEFVTLILLSTLGLFLAVSTRNFLILFCALELSALTSYALAAFNTTSTKCSEGALKYFILGALISAISVFGISFIYGFSRSLDFADIGNMVNNSPNIGLIIGLVLFLISIFFKLSAAPLHFWTPDVYEGSPIASVSYFASASKLGSLLILINIMSFVTYDYQEISVNLIKIIAIFSMIIGALGAIKQHSLKRLMAYGAILNTGYSLIAVALNNETGYETALMNMAIYTISVLGFFTLLIALLGTKSDDANFDDIAGAASSRKAIAAALALIMFSMIGIPPFAGFFGKYYIFYQAVKTGEFTLVAVGVITSVISAYYYLKIIKAMYFTNAITEIELIPTRYGLLLPSVLTTGFILLFSVYFNGFGIV